MDEMLRQILQELKKLSDGQTRLQQDVSELKQDVTALKMGQARLESDTQGIMALGQAAFDQVGMLTEFRTEINDKLDKLAIDTISRHERILERLSVRSIEQEAEIIDLRRAK